jgi:hypothetical protein
MTLDPLSIMLGWAGCILFIAVWELISRLTAARRTRRRFEQLTAARETEAFGDVCAWPVDAKFPHRLQGIHPGGGVIVQLHKKDSSRLLSGGSERPL